MNLLNELPTRRAQKKSTDDMTKTFQLVPRYLLFIYDAQCNVWFTYEFTRNHPNTKKESDHFEMIIYYVMSFRVWNFNDGGS